MQIPMRQEVGCIGIAPVRFDRFGAIRDMHHINRQVCQNPANCDVPLLMRYYR